MTSRFASILSAALFLVALSTNAYAQSPVGTWDVAIDAGGTTMNAVLTINESAAALSGTFAVTDFPAMTLQNVRFAADTLRFEFDTQDYGKIVATLAVKGNSISGTQAGGFGEVPLTGTRKASAAVSFNRKSLMGDLLANPGARAVIDKHVPGLSTHPQIDQAAGITLEELAVYASDMLSEKVILAIEEDLAKL